MSKVAFISLLFFATSSFAQKNIYIKVVAGNYWMEDLKEMQRQFNTGLSDNDIPAKIVSSFPISLQGELGIDFTLRDDLLRKLTIGGFINYAITEGRITYSDYSGSLNIHHDLKRVVVGSRASIDLANNFAVYGKAGLNWTFLEIQFKTELQGAGMNEYQSEFQSLGLAIEPGVQWSKQFKRIRFLVNAGYELSLNGKLTDSDGGYLIKTKEDPIKADWSGFRIGTAISFPL